MLYFQTKPDPVFLAILHQALDTELNEVTRISVEKDFDVWEAEYSQISSMFTPYSALVTLEQLLATSKDSMVYRLTDFHWLLLYECLKNYCAIHNDMAREEPDGCLPVGGYRLREIDFEDLAVLYFWDTDFLLLPTQGEAATIYSSYLCEGTETSIDLTSGIHPLPTELKLIPVDNPAWRVSAPDDYFYIFSVRYPDFEQDPIERVDEG